MQPYKPQECDMQPEGHVVAVVRDDASEHQCPHVISETAAAAGQVAVQ